MEQNLEKTLKSRIYMMQSSSGRILSQLKRSHNKLQNSLLVPKIYTDSVKRSDGQDQASVGFKDGKIVLQTVSKKQGKRHKPSNSEARQPMRPIEQEQLTEQARALLKSTTVGKLGSSKAAKQGYENLSPRNIFSFFEKFPQMHLDFFYLNKFSHPYDYRIVPFDQRNQQEYMTISCKGITQFIGKEAHFMTRQEWMAEEDMYYQLQQIDFFKKYKVNKNFRIWKNMMKRHYMKDMSTQLSQRMFVIGPSQSSLLRIKQYCIELEEHCKMLNYGTHIVYNLQQFRNFALKHQQQGMVSSVKVHEQKILDQLVNCVEQSVQDYKKLNNIVESNSDQPRKNKLDYSKEALLRMHYVRLWRLIKLIDSFMLDSKTIMIQNNLSYLLETLKSINTERKDEWIVCKAGWTGKIITWTPDRSRIKDTFLQLIQNAVRLLQQHNMSLQQRPQFDKYRIEQQRPDPKKDDKVTIKTMCNASEEYSLKLTQISQQLDQAFDRVEEEQMRITEFVNIYEKHQRLKGMSIDSLGATDLRKILAEFQEESAKMDSMQERSELGLIQLDFTELRARIRQAPSQSRALILQKLPTILGNRSAQLSKNIEQCNRQLSGLPTDVASFITFTKSVNRVASCIEDLANDSRQLNYLVMLMEQLKITNLERYRGIVKELPNKIQELRNRIEKYSASYDSQLTNIRRDLQNSTKDIEAQLTQLKQKYTKMPLNLKDSSIQHCIDEIQQIRKPLLQLVNEANKINEYQNQLELLRTSFGPLYEFNTESQLVEKLWTGRKDWKQTVQTIKNCHFLSINIEKLTNQFNETVSLASMLMKQLEANEVARVFNDQVMIFDLVIQTLAALHDPHLRDKQQWAYIPLFLYTVKNPNAESEGQPASYPLYNRHDPKYTVSWLITQQLYLYKDQLSYFSTKACKQQQLTNSLNELKNYLNEAEISLVMRTEGGDGLLLGNNDRLFSDIDDKLMVLNGIMANKFVQNLRPRVQGLLKQYRYLQELFEQMVEHQTNWLYLQPLLSNSAYSAKSLIKQAKQFASCDANWRKITKNLRDNPCIKRIADDSNTGNYLRTISKNNSSFEQIRKSLEEYIEKKRATLPRFYFLSNEQLLRILSIAKTPRSLQHYLCKFFHHVKQLIYDKDQPCGISNFDGDQLVFRQFSLRPQAEVEQILKMVEQHTKRSLNALFKSTIQKYEKQEISRIEMVDEVPFQVASITDWVIWTQITEEYLDPDYKCQMQEWQELQQQQIVQAINALHRSTSSKRKRSISSMILQLLYFRQRTQSLISKDITSPNDSQWLMAVKLYANSSAPEIFLKQFSNRIEYGFQFMDLPSSCVITAPTERVFMDINAAFLTKSLVSVQGDSGTGKSHTIRYLAEVVAQNVINFNCSAESSIRVLQRILIGCCLTGSWLILNNFEKLKLEVASTMAAHFFDIRKALVDSKEGISLVRTNITLNHNIKIVFDEPEANKNLRSITRSVSMIEPPLQAIVSCLMQANGFSSFRQLSQNLVKIADFCRLMFPQIKHSFGLRILKTTIQQMSTLKLQDQSEQEIMCLAVKQIFQIQLDAPKQQIFSQFLSLHYRQPSKVKSTLSYDLYQRLKYVSSMVVSGPPVEGKSFVIEEAAILQSATIHHLNHESYATSQLFGEHDAEVKGLVPHLLKQMNGEKEHWVVVDGKLNPTLDVFCRLVDEMNSVFDSSGEKLMPKRLKIIYETESLSNVSPSFLSQTGHIEVNNIHTFESVIEKSLSDIGFAEDMTKMLQNQLISCLRKLFASRKSYETMLKVSDLNIASSCCNAIKAFVSSEDQGKIKDIKKAAERLAIWGIVWGTGLNSTTDSLPRFEKVLSEICRLDNLPSSSIFNYCLGADFQWLTWDEAYPPDHQKIDQFSDIFLWTSEALAQRYFIKAYIQNLNPFLLIGERGSGKSTILSRVCEVMTREDRSLVDVPLTIGQSQSPALLQNLIEQRLQFQRRNGKALLMPAPGRKLLIHIEDLYLGRPNVGCLELIRNQMCHRGLFDRTSYIWKQLEDVVYSASTQPNLIDLADSRLLNRFTLLGIHVSESSLLSIFSNLTNCWFRLMKLPEDSLKLLTSTVLIEATMKLYNFMKSEEWPNIHHTLLSFSPCDIYRVFESMSRVSEQYCTKSEHAIKLWANQFMRVFLDRIPYKQSKDRLWQQLHKQVFITLKYDIPQAFYRQPMLYCSSINTNVYGPINYENACLYLRQKMIELSPKFSLLIFKQLVQHIIHAIRSLSLRYGHHLIIGPRTSGKKSIVQLACFVTKISLSLEQHKQPKKLENIVIKAAQGYSQCLYVGEDSLTDADLMNRINSILNRSIIPISFPQELLERVCGLSSDESASNLVLKQSYRNLHIVIGGRPESKLWVGLINNPQILANCNIDFMDVWPDEALFEVASINMSEDVFEKQDKAKIAKIASMFYRTIEDLIATKAPYVIVSPRKYLELISLFSYKYQVGREQSLYVIAKLQRCLNKFKEISDIFQIEQISSAHFDSVIKSTGAKEVQIQQEIDNLKKQLESTEEGAQEHSKFKKQIEDISVSMKTLHNKIKMAADTLNSITKQQLLELNQPKQHIMKLNSVIQILSLDANTQLILPRLKTIDLKQSQQLIKRCSEQLKSTPAYLFENPLKQIVQFINTLSKLLNEKGQIGKEYDEIVKQTTKSDRRLILLHEIKCKQAESHHAKYAKEVYQAEIRESKDRVTSAKQILALLSEQHKNWSARLENETSKLNTLTYDLLFACSVFNFLGPFKESHRKELMQLWVSILDKQGVSYGQLDLLKSLFDPYEVDSLRYITETNLLNCLMLLKSPSIPYFLDKQSVSLDYLTAICPEIKTIVYSDDEHFEKQLKDCVVSGSTVFIKYREPTVKNSILRLINKNVTANKKTVQIRNETVDCPDSFKFFLCNNWPDLRLQSQLYENCCVIQFTLTKSLVEQVVRQEVRNALASFQKHSLEEQNNRLSDMSIENKKLAEKFLSIVETLSLYSHLDIDELKKLKNRKIELKAEINQKCSKIRELSQSLATWNNLIHHLTEISWLAISQQPTISLSQIRRHIREALKQPEDILHQVACRIYHSNKCSISKSLQFSTKLLIKQECLKNNEYDYGKICQILRHDMDLKRLQQSSIIENIQRFIEGWQDLKNCTGTIVDKLMSEPYKCTFIESILIVKCIKSDFQQHLSDVTSTYFRQNTNNTVTVNKTTCLIGQKHYSIQLMLKSKEKNIQKDAYCEVSLRQPLQSIQQTIMKSVTVLIKDLQQQSICTCSHLLQWVRSQTLRQDFQLYLLVSQAFWNTVMPTDLKEQCLGVIVDPAAQTLFNLPPVNNLQIFQKIIEELPQKINDLPPITDIVEQCIQRQCITSNSIVSKITTDLKNIEKYFKQEGVADDHLLDCLKSNRVPRSWQAGTQKSLDVWLNDLKNSHQTLRRYCVSRECLETAHIRQIQRLVVAIQMKFAKKNKLKFNKVGLVCRTENQSNSQNVLAPMTIVFENCRPDIPKSLLEDAEGQTKCSNLYLVPCESQKQTTNHLVIRLPIYRRREDFKKAEPLFRLQALIKKKEETREICQWGYLEEQ